MKWWYIFMVIGSFVGPFDTLDECREAVHHVLVLDPGFYGAAHFGGICFQGEWVDWRETKQ